MRGSDSKEGSLRFDGVEMDSGALLGGLGVRERSVRTLTSSFSSGREASWPSLRIFRRT